MSNIILIIAIMHTKNAHKSHEWNSNTCEINDNNNKKQFHYTHTHTHAENVANLKANLKKEKKLDKKYNIFFCTH